MFCKQWSTAFKELIPFFLVTELSRKIMCGIALALGGRVDAFEGEVAGDPFCVVRFIGYPGLSDKENPDIKCNDIGW